MERYIPLCNTVLARCCIVPLIAGFRHYTQNVGPVLTVVDGYQDQRITSMEAAKKERQSLRAQQKNAVHETLSIKIRSSAVWNGKAGTDSDRDVRARSADKTDKGSTNQSACPPGTRTHTPCILYTKPGTRA